MYPVSIMEVLVWAVAYVVLDAIEELEKALYFSMVTFTTLGYGDVVLDKGRRLLASIEAVNGIIMFGWSTAILIAAVERVYYRREADGHDRHE
jgi:voltage-gated potassium channel Kch